MVYLYQKKKKKYQLRLGSVWLRLIAGLQLVDKYSFSYFLAQVSFVCFRNLNKFV